MLARETQFPRGGGKGLETDENTETQIWRLVTNIHFPQFSGENRIIYF